MAQTPATPLPVAAATRLREAGLRVTEPRVAVLDALATMPHSGAEAVFTVVAATLPTTSRQAVYNVLNDLAGAGIVRRIEPAGQPGLFELRVGDNHHHVVCSGCGKVEDIDCVTGHAPCLIPNETKGFEVAEAEVTFWGRCSDCRASAAQFSSTSPIHTPI